MSQKFLLAWAIGATALALVFLGYALGKKAGVESVGPAPLASQDTEAGGAGAAPADPYVVPPSFTGLPAEWRTQFDGRNFDGYAMLFDPLRRELIVEKCRHRGYMDRRSGKLIDSGWEFCEGALWGRLQRIDDQGATVVDRKLGTVEVKIGLDGEAGAPRLLLSFLDHNATLIPGSKNDLLQAMENSPEIVEQKSKYLLALAAEDDARRRVARETGQAKDVPTYSLPERAGEKDRDE